jgi:CRP-like cAMP-binding protein
MEHGMVRAAAHAGEAPHASADEATLRLLASSPFAGLAPPSRAALLAITRRETLPRHRRFVLQGEVARSLLLIGSGCVRLERTSHGRSLPLGHRGPGDSVGETGLVAGSASETAVVADAVDGLVVPLASLRKLMLQDGALRLAAIALLVGRCRASEDRLEALLLRSVEGRLASFLLAALARWGQPHADGAVIAVPFTHADAALVIGSTRETVTVALSRMRRAGLIAFDRRRVVVRDRPALAARVA